MIKEHCYCLNFIDIFNGGKIIMNNFNLCLRKNPLNSGFQDFLTDFNDFFNDSFFNPVIRPSIDLLDKGNEYEIRTELPGMDKKDIHITVEENSVTIRGEQKFQNEKESNVNENSNTIYSERMQRKFFRKIPLPQKVIPDKAKAEYKDGILSLLVEKNPKSQVEVEVQ